MKYSHFGPKKTNQENQFKEEDQGDHINPFAIEYDI